jgi:predicted enzyme related to lactoylglutathione lyase
MKRTITAILGITAVIWMAAGQADVTVMAVRLGAKDAGQLARFYQTVFGLKEIDHVGQPATEVIMRYGASVAAAKAGNSPEFLVANRAAGESASSLAHAVFQVSDIAATVAAAKAAGAKVKGDVASVPIGGTPIKIATLNDPDGNLIELMELPKGLDHLPH